jgi:hypothetical protein
MNDVQRGGPEQRFAVHVCVGMRETVRSSKYEMRRFCPLNRQMRQCSYAAQEEVKPSKRHEYKLPGH